MQPIQFEGQNVCYPGVPGAKGPDGTSQDAAAAIEPRVSHLRSVALHALAKLGDATVLEAVSFAGVSRESLQPRFSELRAMGLVEATGARRRNPSGKAAAALRLTDKGRDVIAVFKRQVRMAPSPFFAPKADRL